MTIIMFNAALPEIGHFITSDFKIRQMRMNLLTMFIAQSESPSDGSTILWFNNTVHFLSIVGRIRSNHCER